MAKKKKFLFVLLAVVAVLLAAVYKIPKELDYLLPVDLKDVYSVDFLVDDRGLKNEGRPYMKMSSFESRDGDEHFDELMKIMQKSKYSPDFRNLLLIGETYKAENVVANAQVRFFTGNTHYSITFFDSGKVIAKNNVFGYASFSMTNPDMIYELADYVQKYGDTNEK